MEQSTNTSFGKKYLLFLIIYMALYEVFDTYTTSFYPVVVSYIQADFHIDISEYYFALSIASLGLFAVLLIQFLTDFFGRKPMMIVVFFGMGISAFLLAQSQNLTQYTIALFFMFMFFSSDIWVIMVSEQAPPEKRARYSYLVSFIGIVGVVVIPLFRSLLIDPSVPHTWTAMTYFAWAAIPLALLGFFLKESPAFLQAKAKRELKDKWAWSRIVQNINAPFKTENRAKLFAFIVIGFVLGLNFNTFQTIESLISAYIVNDDQVSLIILIGGVGSILTFGLTGILADKFGRKPIMIIYSFVCFLGISGLVWATTSTNIIGVYIFVVIAQYGYWGTFTLSKVYCVECFETSIRGSCTGWRSFAYAVGLSLGALISSGLTQVVSLGTSYILNALWAVILIPILVKKFLPERKGCIIKEE